MASEAFLADVHVDMHALYTADDPDFEIVVAAVIERTARERAEAIRKAQG